MSSFGRPTTYRESLERLQGDGVKGRPPSPRVSAAGTLPLRAIKFADTVFQPRTFDGQRAASTGHIQGLAEAIRHSAGHRLDPITVWWSGVRWIVIDGHHRLAAYQLCTKTKRKRPLKIDAVPVEVFEGSLHEAIGEATRLNSKDKLPMSRVDKAERSWKLVAQDTGLSLRKIADMAGTSKSLVGNMVKRLQEYRQENPGADSLNATWDEVRTGEKRTVDDDFIAKQEKDFARRLSKEFGAHLLQRAALVAGGIRQYSEALPGRLIAEWDDGVPRDEFDELVPEQPFVNPGEEQAQDF